MSTRSSIAVVLEDGSIVATCCHFDGYVKGGVGEALFKRIKTFDDAKKLVMRGELRSFDLIDGADYYECGSLEVSRFGSFNNYAEEMSRGIFDYFYIFMNKDWHVCKIYGENIINLLASFFKEESI